MERGNIGFASSQQKKKRPMLQNRPPNVNKLPSTVFLKLAEQLLAPHCLSAEQLLRAGLFLKYPDRLVVLNEPNLLPRLGSLALPRSPESGVAVSTHAKFLSREKRKIWNLFFLYVYILWSCCGWR